MSTTITFTKLGNALYWMDNDQIAVVYVGENRSRASVDDWIGLIQRIFRHQDDASKTLILYDFMERHFDFNPYVQEKFKAIYQMMPTNHPICIAYALRPGPQMDIVNVFIRRGLGRPQNVREKVFNTKYTALDWLRQNAP